MYYCTACEWTFINFFKWLISYNFSLKKEHSLACSIVHHRPRIVHLGKSFPSLPFYPRVMTDEERTLAVWYGNGRCTGRLVWAKKVSAHIFCPIPCACTKDKHKTVASGRASMCSVFTFFVALSFSPLGPPMRVPRLICISDVSRAPYRVALVTQSYEYMSKAFVAETNLFIRHMKRKKGSPVMKRLEPVY